MLLFVCDLVGEQEAGPDADGAVHRSQRRRLADRHTSEHGTDHHTDGGTQRCTDQRAHRGCSSR
ncbi:MAG: hypothetical protein AAGE88_15065 [Actinomycetota bacterium]